MAVPYIQPRIDVVEFLTRQLGLSIFIQNDTHEYYRMQIKEHIVTVKIKIDSWAEGPDLITTLNIDEKNIWWHKLPYHSGYTLDSIEDFSETEFVRTISFNSQWFSERWRDYADL
jgi:hypothetical protein